MRLPHSSRRDRSAGFSAIEILVVLALMGATSGMLFFLLSSSTGLATQSLESARLKQKSAVALTRIVSELRNASVGTYNPPLDPALPVFGSEMTALRVTDTDAGGPVLGSPIRIWTSIDPLEADDGIDNDDDGLIDEYELRMTVNEGLPNARTILLARGVSELAFGEQQNALDDNGDGLADETGLTFRRIGRTLRVGLTLSQRLTSGQVVTDFREAFIETKND